MNMPKSSAMPLAAAFGIALTLAPAVAAPSAARSGGPCLSDDDEARLQRRETQLLGARHAAEHAGARDYECRVAQGRVDLSSEKAAQRKAAASIAGPFSSTGLWSRPFDLPALGVTAVLLHTGKVLFWSYDVTQYGNPAASNTGTAYLWDYRTRSGYPIAPPENIWCGGQTLLADGRVFVAGGNLRYPDPGAPPGQREWMGSLSSYTFDPGSETWTRQPDMAHGRWYPTVTQLADNTAVIASGFDENGGAAINQAVELFTPSAATDGVGTMRTVSYRQPGGLYPFQYLLGSGRLLQAGPLADNSAVLDPAGWSWTDTPAMLNPHREYTNGILYVDAGQNPPRQLVMIAGGASGEGTLSANEWLDGNDPAAGWRPYPNWLKPRHNGNTVILPDGTLFTVGGNLASNNYDGTLFQSELYDRPAGDTGGRWVEVAPNSIQAAYHSTAILLPDATVLLVQDDRVRTPQAVAAHQAQIYSPPYLFKTVRPQITQAPATARLGEQIVIETDSPAVSRAVLVAPGAVTHANDMHQRFVRLQTSVSGTRILATLPASAGLVPPGYYMLFVLNSNGVPSVSRFIRIG